MKKLLVLIMVLMLALSLLVSCTTPDNPSDDVGGQQTPNPDDTTGGQQTPNPDDTTGGQQTPNPDDTTGGQQTPNPDDTTGGQQTPNPDDTTGDNGGKEDPPPEDEYDYTYFTSSEKELFTTLIGELIPFLPTDDYSLEVGSDEYGTYLNYYTYGNTQEDFDAYLASLDGYTLVGTEVYDGDTWYYYEKGDICIDASFYVYEGDAVVDMYIYLASGSTGGDVVGGTLYTDFTATEKELFVEHVGELIPFLPSYEYYLDEYSDEYGFYLNYYTFGNTQEEFNSYLASLEGYTFVGTEVYDGETWYYYEKGDICIEAAFYTSAGTGIVDIYVYLASDDGTGDVVGGTLYTDFTATEKELFVEHVGELIPFLPSYEYYLDEYSDEYGFYLNYYTFGNTQEEFNSYLASLEGYTFVGTEVYDGETWYYYEKGDICIEAAFYTSAGTGIVDIYVYLASDDGTGGGTGGTDADLITNDGKGLPTDEDGVHDVDFTTATNVKDVTDQGYYLDGCPTTGSPAVLVIPVDFSDVTAQSKGYDISKLVSAFASNDASDGFYSVYEYYYISSYGQLTLDFTVLDDWFRPQYNSEYYATATDSEGYFIGDQLIIDEALAYLSGIMDLSELDSDGNTVIDAIVLVNTLDIDDTNDFYWAYRYWNYYTDDGGYYYEYDGVSANDYLWASFDFLHEGYDADGYVNYDDNTLMNTYTFIHEFGHILGADDYYDTEGVGEPMVGCDIMDGMLGDHNAFTKFNYGWLTTSRLVVCEASVTLTLEDFSKNGDTIIIANNWDDTLGAYQEYYILVYYKNVGLNSGDNGYFSRDGVVVYHVNASLYTEEYVYEDGTVVYYDIYNNNTDPSGEYGTEDNLIEYVKSASDTYTYVEGDTMGAVTDDSGNALVYNFVVDSLTEDAATITFTRA